MTDKTTTPKLKKFEKFEVISVDYSDLEDLVQRVYSQPDYSFVSSEELGNDSQKLYKGIDGKLDKWEEDDIRSFRENGECNYKGNAILNDLCRNGYLQPGNYLIDICW